MVYQGYVDAYKLARERSGKVNLWPVDFIDFLQQKLNSLFTINSYILDEQKLVNPSEDNVAHPQETPYSISPLDFDPFKKLIRVDIISAQRWLEDSDGDNGDFKSETNLLSNQLRDY